MYVREYVFYQTQRVLPDSANNKAVVATTNVFLSYRRREKRLLAKRCYLLS